ncbi:DNA topoisomerase III [Bacillus shivajii]|uniref:DNA topoisomerase III n=1 Tax=Bacillus shivajii TaxID=1983719 RepID=UPI001CFA15EA|nr:DNA topoisomerase III [Bacillus shivajii]UCZ55183.1 DNA topoisomerase III [Bacillus shivajii]
MFLIIAEKPDQGAKLAAPFPHKKKQGYIQIDKNDQFPNGAILTWAVGHLCELIPPEEYNASWKKWSLNTLPIIPSTFQYKVSKSKWKQFNVIKNFVQDSSISEIIIAGDAEREGEAIVRIILNQCKNRKPLKRLWISSLTPNAVKKGFANLIAGKDTENLYAEALSRAYADWLVGMNASRAYTLLLQQKGISDVFSTGRVQTPTLALIVKRELEIEKFVSEPFWQVFATFNMNGKTYEGKWHKENESRIDSEDLAIRIATFCEGKNAIVQNIERTKKDFLPPYFFNLSSLQATANKRYKFPPKKTLDIAQKLYIKGIISYPRSDSNFVTKDEAEMFPTILNKIKEIDSYKNYFPLPETSLINNKRYVNEKKVSDHYAIIPTEQVMDPSKLANDEEKIYRLILERLIAAHDEKSIFNYTTIHTLVDERATFISKGKELVQLGWRRILGNENKNKQDKEEQQLPNLENGEEGIALNAYTKEGKTQPPKRYTEGELITLMKTAGKHIEDEELIKVLKETEGLGTEATRAGIINVLKDRNYITVQKNTVYPTEKGKVLIEAVGNSILASPEMTAKWEDRLSDIGKGAASDKQFIEQVKKLSAKLIQDALQASPEWTFDKYDLTQIQPSKWSKTKTKGKFTRQTKPLGKCKSCDGDIVDKGSFYGCSNYKSNECTFTLSKKVLGKSISQTNIRKLLSKGKTDVIKDFKKNDKTFQAALVWNDEKKKIEFHFPK